MQENSLCFQLFLSCNNVLLYGLPDSTVKLLQRVQNYGAHIVTRLGIFLHFTLLSNKLFERKWFI